MKIGVAYDRTESAGWQTHFVLAKSDIMQLLKSFFHS